MLKLQKCREICGVLSASLLASFLLIILSQSISLGCMILYINKFIFPLHSNFGHNIITGQLSLTERT